MGEFGWYNINENETTVGINPNNKKISKIFIQGTPGAIVRLYTTGQNCQIGPFGILTFNFNIGNNLSNYTGEEFTISYPAGIVGTTCIKVEYI